EGLRGRAAGEGMIGLYELYQYIYATVHSATAGGQEPVLTLLQGVGPFPVALNAGGSLGRLDPAAIRQQPPTGTALELVDRPLAVALGTAAKAFHIKAGRDVTITQDNSLIKIGSHAQIGRITTGDVVQGIKVVPAVAAQAGDRVEVAECIDR